MNSIFKILLSLLILIGQFEFSYAQTASILPPAQTTFVDKNGKPLTSGTVEFFIPGTTTRKMTWQDAGQTIPNANPLTLDGSGRATILGDGSYRQVLKDRNGNIVWDGYTASTGSGGGGTTPTVGDGDAVGTIKAYSGFTTPYGYAFAYGQELVRTSYAEAFAVLTSQQNVSCTSGSPTLTGVGTTTQLPIGAPIESACLNSGSTIISKTTSTVTASSNAIISTTTTARFFPFGNGDGSLTFNVPDLRGRVIAGNDIMGGIAANRLTSTYYGANADALGANGGNESQTLTVAQMPSHSHANTLTDPGHSHTVPFVTTGSSGQTGGSAFTMGVGNQTTTLNTTGITINNVNTGGGNAHTIVQPTQTQNYIIKIIPDSNPSSFFGVASIGGMTGIITCGTGITCAGNNISAVSSETSAGGAHSQIQFNDAGLLGGFSANGDAVIDTSTGTVTVTRTNNVLFSPSATIDATNADNILSGTLNTSILPTPFTNGTSSGNTSNFATTTGSIVSGNCAQWDANDNIIDSGSPCSNTKVVFATQADAIAASIPPTILEIKTLDYATSGDGGGGTYIKVGVSCSAPGCITTANGMFFRNAGPTINCKQFGAVNDGTGLVNQFTALSACINFANANTFVSELNFGSGVFGSAQQLPCISRIYKVRGENGGAQPTILIKSVFNGGAGTGFLCYGSASPDISDLNIRALSGTGGSGISVVNPTNTASSGNIRLNNIIISMGDFAQYAIYIDGSANTIAPLGARNGYFTNLDLFNSSAGVMGLISVENFFCSNCSFSSIGGTGPNGLFVTGVVGVGSDNLNFSGVFACNLTMDRVTRANFFGAGNNINNTANTSNVRFWGTRSGTTQANWVGGSGALP